MKRVRETTASAVKKARKTFDRMRQGMMAPVFAPTPFIDAKGRRINRTNNGAVFTRMWRVTVTTARRHAVSLSPHAPMKTITRRLRHGSQEHSS